MSTHRGRAAQDDVPEDGAGPAAGEVSEALVLVTAGTVPGTDPGALAQHLADAVVHLPVPAAAMIGAGTIPADIRDRARELGERQHQAAAAQDLVQLYARLWFRPSAVLPADATEVAIALRGLWEERLRGAASGLVSVVCLPARSEAQWMAGARECHTLAETTRAPLGLLPGPH
ncbi:hypothetical protein ABT354_20255 [Streptomyces sp. NPDC000594]|uniref:hypothetical protein n=1 Tax=Streptomyces sp. NPDC000594 TaxID=3154261 RepID=UPI0033237CC6